MRNELTIPDVNLNLNFPSIIKRQFKQVSIKLKNKKLLNAY